MYREIELTIYMIFFYPNHCASILMIPLYSSLGWRNLCSQQSHCLHCSLFCSRNVEYLITTQRIFVQLNLISTSTSASTAHGTFRTNKVHEKGVVEGEAQGSLNNEHLMTEQTKQVKFITDRRVRKR